MASDNMIKHQRGDFTQIPNKLLRSNNISMKAKGLYCIMYSKPSGWLFIDSAIISESTDGKDSYLSAMKELVDTGWVTKEGGGRGTDGQWERNIYIINDRDGKTVTEKPSRENRDGKTATNNTIEEILITNTDNTISMEKDSEERKSLIGVESRGEITVPLLVEEARRYGMNGNVRSRKSAEDEERKKNFEAMMADFEEKNR